ncbi:MAG: PhnD/SsuA/transferrin family substrate-binding protein [Mycoplasmatales bacterium]|nr:PhnD/SsuA/transferrin family substrate-binding protein [Mycoplasmatales bacterium]
MKYKKRILGVAAIASVLAPVMGVISCGSSDSTDSSKDLKISLGIPTKKDNADKILSEMNDPAFTKEVLDNINSNIKNDEDKVKSISFTMNTDNDGVARSVKLGNATMAFLPSAELRKFKNDIDIIALASRNAMKGDNDSTASGDSLETTTMKFINDYLTELGSSATSDPDSIYETDKSNDYYRAAIYFDDPAAKQAWDDSTGNNDTANLDKFVKTGMITHGSTSESGYLTPERMIKKHFGVDSFHLSSYPQNVKKGHMANLADDGYGVYFSYAGELIQKGLENSKKFLTDNESLKNMRVLALSDSIINDGMAVNKDLSDELKNAILMGFKKTITTNNNRAPFTVYYHKSYKGKNDDNSNIAKLTE